MCLYNYSDKYLGWVKGEKECYKEITGVLGTVIPLIGPPQSKREHLPVVSPSEGQCVGSSEPSAGARGFGLEPFPGAAPATDSPWEDGLK